MYVISLNKPNFAEKNQLPVKYRYVPFLQLRDPISYSNSFINIQHIPKYFSWSLNIFFLIYYCRD